MLITGYSIYYFTKWNGYVITFSGLVIILAFSYHFTYSRLFKLRTPSLHSIKKFERLPRKKGLVFWLPLQLLGPGIVQILPMMFLLNQLDFSEGTNDWTEIVIVTVLASAIVTIGILPGAIVVNERKKQGWVTSITAILVSIPVVIAVFSVWYRPLPNMVINMAMYLSGISDWRTHQYYIERKTYSHAMFNNALWNTRYYKDIPEKFFITGVSAFSLGNIKLVCPAEIKKARKESMKFTVNDFSEYDKKGKDLKAIAMRCIAFNKNDIHTWDSPLPEPIYYEKVKLMTENSMIEFLHMLK